MSTLLAALARFAVRHRRWVLGGWLLAGAVLNVTVPQLEAVAAHDTTPFLPASAASQRGYVQMDRSFDSGGVRALTFVILQDNQGLSPAGRAYASDLATRLRAGVAHVAQVQPLQLSPDGKAAYASVGIRHPLGSPKTDADITWLRHTVSAGRPASLQAYITGDAAVYADANSSVARSILTVTILTTFIIIAILLALYRSWLASLIPLVTIGVGLGVARGVVALMGQSFLTVSTYTGLFVMALVMGAGTDYSVFVVSRYHEAIQDGADSDDAVVEASRRIGPVIAASGATVVLGAACLAVAKLALFSTTGPAIAVAVAVTLVASLSFTPALLAWLGPQTRPRTSLASPGWHRVGALVARHPAALALTSVLLLGALAAFYPAVHPTYDNRKLVPSSSSSERGYAAFNAHFPPGQLQPDFVLIKASHDLRTSSDLASLDSVIASLAAVPGVVTVQGVTRPAGLALPAAQLAHLMSVVGGSLGDAAHRVQQGNSRIDSLTNSATQLARGASTALAPSLATYLSPDGRTARLIAFGDDHGSHVTAENAAVTAALRGTSLAGAQVSSTGPWAGRDDVKTYAQADLLLVAVAALAAILLVLVLLLRSLVAPLYLLATVVLSYGATMGVTNLLWHDLLGRPLDFTVPLLAFIILVAVGADYNILLMSRLREESRDASRVGVARAITATGKVITSAGLIFAGSFVGMIASPVIGLAETGFAVGFGLLLDTFLVRSLLVPSVAALLGPLNWWPSVRVTAVDLHPQPMLTPAALPTAL